ncbi:MAG: hypothetical protein JKY32_08195 [Rhizobiales bacterium]|nr:hypothetical protein [Hyphomicrobiales bacterium]
MSTGQIGTFHTLADRLIPGEIARPETLKRVQDWTQCSLHMRTGTAGTDLEPDAILASIRLTGAGRKAVLDRSFGFDDAAQSWICRPGQDCAALLSWGMAGASRRAQTATLRALMASWRQFYAATPVLARGRSVSGQKLLIRLGFRRLDTQGSRSSENYTGFDQEAPSSSQDQTYICDHYPRRFDADLVRSPRLCGTRKAA